MARHTSSKEPQSVIQFLDSVTIDKIAAGEVVEGPSSCIKELVDNAIDAQASEIVIEISVGGREKIKVSDNGIGMVPGDLEKAVERYATSKIKAIDDLERLTTMGFRGEALSSIASVSKLTLTSCKRFEEKSELSFSEHGAQIVVHGGKKIAFQHPMTASFGTTVEIESLFYNVPARRKFLKSPQRDAQEIFKTVVQLALSAPQIGFQYIVDGIQKLSVQPSTFPEAFKERIIAVFGKDVAADGLFIDEELSDRIYMRAFLGFPEIAKTTRSMQYIIVNGRPVQSLMISYAVKAGYSTSIGRDQHPVFVCHLSLPSEEIDVNVHPQKREIRFKDEEELKRMIIHAVGTALFKVSSFDSLEHTPSLTWNSNTGDGEALQLPETRHIEEKEVEARSPSKSIFNESSVVGVETFDSIQGRSSIFQKREFDQEPLFKESTTPVFSYTHDEPKSGKAGESPQWMKLCSAGSYITVSYSLPPFHKQASAIVNLKTAFKASLLSQLARAHEDQSRKVASEALLVPHLLRVSSEQSLFIENSLQEIESLGFSLRPFGAHTFLIEAVPQGTTLAAMDLDLFFTKISTQAKGRDDSEEGCFFTPCDDNSPEIGEELLKSIRRAGIIMSSMKIFQLNAAPIPAPFIEKIVKDWIDMGAPLYTLLGEKIALHTDQAFLDKLFARREKV